MKCELLGLDDILHPRSIAVIGASDNPLSRGYRFLEGLLDFGFGGKLYPINPRHDEILGLKIYPTIAAVPETVDYVISCVPARDTVRLMPDCAAKKVKAVHVYSAGFSETRETLGIELERELVQAARQAGVRLIGPNCLGLHHPRLGVTFVSRAGFSRESGQAFGLFAL